MGCTLSVSVLRGMLRYTPPIGIPLSKCNAVTYICHSGTGGTCIIFIELNLHIAYYRCLSSVPVFVLKADWKWSLAFNHWLTNASVPHLTTHMNSPSDESFSSFSSENNCATKHFISLLKSSPHNILVLGYGWCMNTIETRYYKKLMKELKLSWCSGDLFFICQASAHSILLL